MKNTEMQEQQQPMITASMFAARYRSKKECYNFLACQCGAYLPPCSDSVTIYHLVDCATNVRSCMYQSLLNFLL